MSLGFLIDDKIQNDAGYKQYEHSESENDVVNEPNLAAKWNKAHNISKLKMERQKNITDKNRNFGKTGCHLVSMHQREVDGYIPVNESETKI